MNLLVVLPVVATWGEALNEDALIQILQEPKNALTKQYQALFKLEGVDFRFRKDALTAVAKKRCRGKEGRVVYVPLRNCIA